jgi:CheY-like chemotaxis protein
MTPQVFLIDDDEVDTLAIKRVLARSGSGLTLEASADPVRALVRLKQLAAGPSGELPMFLLLDLNMPEMSGFECLEQIRSDPDLRRIIAFVCSTSSNPTDIARAYDMCVSGYLIKNELGGGYEKLAALLESFVDAVAFPPVH